MVIHETSWTVEITTGPERTLLLCVVTKGLEADVEQTAILTDDQARWLARGLSEGMGTVTGRDPGRVEHRPGPSKDWIVIDDGEKWLLSGDLRHEDRAGLAIALDAQLAMAQILRGNGSDAVPEGSRAGGSK